MTEKILAVLFLFIKSIIGRHRLRRDCHPDGDGDGSACIPLPSELIMPFAGYLVFEGSMNLFWVATAGAIGCNLGSLVAYEMGTTAGVLWSSVMAVGS